MQFKRKTSDHIKVEKPAEPKTENYSRTKGKMKKEKNKPKKKKKLIIRNLSFQVTIDELSEIFSKFGTVLDINIPLKKDGKKRGFAFVEYADTKSLIAAMKSLNNKEIHGRQVAIDFAIDKTSYQLKVQNIKEEKDNSVSNINEVDDSDSEPEEKPDIENVEISEESDLDENEKRAKEFLSEFESGFEAEQSDSEDSSENDSNEDSDDTEAESDEEFAKPNLNKVTSNFKSKDISKQEIKKDSDVSEGKTVFLRNVSFITTQESLKAAMEKYGECEYCVICIDPVTEHSRGTAFVKFKNKDSADRLIEESSNDTGILIDGRKVSCSHAMKKEDISDQFNKDKKPKDKRNLNLLKVGLIMPDSPESEGVSQFDMKKRKQLEMIKRQKLRNVNFFVSDTRVIVHNIPKTWTDVQLRKLFKQAGGKGAIITEARVMKEFKKTNAEGVPLSKGFGFVCFSKHEDALKALVEINNNPNVFSKQKRPIVEFSIENRVALLSKERRKERIQQRNKKRTEEKQERLSSGAVKKETAESNIKESPKKKKKKNRKSKMESLSDIVHAASEESKSEQKSKKNKRKKNLNPKEESLLNKVNVVSQESKTEKKSKKKKKTER